MSSSERNRFVFTASQWQELKHQALVYNHMVSGIPIPSDLLFSIRRSLDSASLCSSFQSNQPQHIEWSGFNHVGFGRKIDPEPGRCRRTDGKKWRCSKEAYPDSKYCERHMHRGRNRSRKPVEVVLSSDYAPNNTQSSSSSFVRIASLSAGSNKPNVSPRDTLRPHGVLGLPIYHDQETTANFFLAADSQSRASAKDCKTNNSIYCGGSSVTDSAWRLTPLTMGTSSLSDGMKQNTHSFDFRYHHSDQNMHKDINGEIEDDQQHPEKVMHHFLDEWPQKVKDSDDETASHMHDFFMTRKW